MGLRSAVCGCAALFLSATAVALPQEAPPTIQAEVQKGIEAMQQGKFAEAEQLLSRALKADPNLVEVRADLGLAYYADRKYSEAVEAFRMALKQKPSVRTAQTFLPLSLAALDRCEEAIPGLRREFPSHPDAKLRRVLGLSLQRCLLQTGKQTEADQVTQQLLGQFPDDVDVLYEAGQMYGKLSSQMYLRLMKVAPHSARGYQVMGEVAAADGNSQKAIEAFRQAIQSDGSLPGVRLDLAVQLLLHSPDPGAWKEALGDLNAELKISPANPDVYFEIGEIYRKHDQPEEALRAFQEALRLRPGFVEARLGLAKVLRQQDRKQEASAVLELARDMAPDNPAVRFLLAQIYRDLGRAAEAQKEEEAFKKLQAAP